MLKPLCPEGWKFKPSLHVCVFQDGVTWSPSTCLHIVDFVPVVGDFAAATLSLSYHMNTPVKYTCIAEQMSEEWIHSNLLENLTQQMLEGHVTPPSGHSIGPPEPPAEHMESKPDPPPLKKLVFVKAVILLRVGFFDFKKCSWH